MKEKILFKGLFVTILLFCSYSSWAYSFNVDGIYYSKYISGLSVGSVQVTYDAYPYNSYSGDIVIPETVTYDHTTYTVISIGTYAFKDCVELTSVSIPANVNEINDSAFDGCTALLSIDVAEDSEYFCSIDDVLYSKDMTKLVKFPVGKGLESFDIPTSVTSIGGYAFDGYSKLMSVTMGNDVTEIGEYAFRKCSGLLSISLPESTTQIGKYAFYSCSGLTTMNIPKGVSKIQDDTFYSCSSLLSVNISESVTAIGSYAFSYCSKLKQIIIPNSVVSIGDRAFENCTGLTEISIGSGLAELGDYIFQKCSELTNIEVAEDNNKKI